jgi:acetyl-CoA carboxylase biotin carboxyl carrier protein
VVRARANSETAPAAQAVSQPAPQAAPASSASGPHPGAITSPMVGTAYRARDPDADPFVRIGDLVMEGQTVLIIEAMKVMNDIPAPRAGKVTRILVEDGQPVEYGEPLMIIE